MKVAIFPVNDDFFTDRLCRRYGPLVFLAAGVLIAGAVASPWACSCWAPAHFTDSHTSYTTDACWNNGQFYFFSSEYVPYSFGRIEFSLNKIRYLPVVLLLQILVFFIPRVFWKCINALSGYFSDRIVKATYEVSCTSMATTTTKPENSVRGIVNSVNQHTTSDATAGYQAIATHLITILERPFPFLGGVCSMFGGYVLAIAYMLTKIGYLLTTVIQMAILSGVLDINFFSLQFGDPLWDSVVAHRSKEWGNETVWYDAQLFPRVVLCDLGVRILGNIQRYTLQCTLSANVLVERVVVCVWLWLWVTLLLLSLSCFIWCIRLALYMIAPQSYKTSRLSLLLGTTNARGGPDNKRLDDFAKVLFKPDGALIMEMLEDNVSLVAAAGVVEAAWLQFQQREGAVDSPARGVSEGAPHRAQAPPAQAMYTGTAEQPLGAAETLPLVEKTGL